MNIVTIGETITDCLLHKLRKIATLFLESGEATFISTNCSHYEQKLLYTDAVHNKRRAAQGLPPVTDLDDKLALWQKCAVDLILLDGFVYIRPDSNNMELALEADRFFQEEIEPKVPVELIRFKFASVREIKTALRTAGELWRIAPYPRLKEELMQEVESSRIALKGDPIYYHASGTGTRYLTCGEFAKLAFRDDDDLRRHLIEIRDYSGKFNTHKNREIDFFATDSSFSASKFKNLDLENASPSELRTIHARLTADFNAAVTPDLRRDDVNDNNWLNHMIAAFEDNKDDSKTQKVVDNLPPEFFRMVRFLPGGRFKGRELIFDPVFEQKTDAKSAKELHNLLDTRVKGFFGNYICEFPEIEYINIGRVMPAIRQEGVRPNGHRVFLAEIKQRAKSKADLRILRVLQWGMRERLDEKKDLLTAYEETLEYIEYTKQRRQGCWELGMPLPSRIQVKTIPEIYDGENKKYRDKKAQIWTFYFERDFIDGIATDKIPDANLQDPEFTRNLAQLLGGAAAPNMVVGRMDEEKKKVIFDSGDEILLLNSNQQPGRLVVADHAGTFVDYTSHLITFAKDYAKPVTDRLAKIPNPDEFTEVYLNSLRQRLLELQEECKAQEDAFKKRFLHNTQGPGKFPDRWNKALTRLQETDIEILVETIRMEIEKGR